MPILRSIHCTRRTKLALLQDSVFSTWHLRLQSRSHTITIHDIPDSQLLHNEATVYRHTSQTLLKLAENLYSTGKLLESRANDVGREGECARISEARRRRKPRKFTKSEYGDKVEQEPETLERRSAASAMVAANTLKQEKIINTAVQSLIKSDGALLADKSNEEQGAGGDVLSQLDPDQLPAFICYLSAEMLADPQLITGSAKAENAESSRSSKCAMWEGPGSEDESTSSVDSASPNVEKQRPYMPEIGFVTASGWVAINRRPH